MGTPRLSVLDTPCYVFVLKQQASSSRTKKGIRKTPMETLFVESLKRLEAEMTTNTRNPLSLLQLSMRLVIRLKQSESELPLTLRQKLANEQKIMMVEEELDKLSRALRPCSRSVRRPTAARPSAARIP